MSRGGAKNTVYKHEFHLLYTYATTLHTFQLEQATASHTEHEDTPSPDETANGKMADLHNICVHELRWSSVSTRRGIL